jgi:sensor domain CHASE-containing protein
MGSFEETYDDDELRSFKPTQLKKLQELHVQLDNKFNEIVELLARELSHAKNDPRVHDEAESAIQRWAEDAQMAIETKGELQQLLKEHHQIAEEIMDVRDWAMED